MTEHFQPLDENNKPIPINERTTTEEAFLKDYEFDGKDKNCFGKGSYGKVFIAKHKATEEYVAIKRIPKNRVKEGRPDRDMTNDAIWEFRVSKKLTH